ncbi:MAG: TIR domain-containing protein, partial [Longimicrobiaceae bacterium]
MRDSSDQITLLFVSFSADDRIALRSSEELRAIRERLQSEHGYSVHIEHRWPKRVVDIFAAVLEIQPEILHLSSHGSGDGQVLFEDDIGQRKVVSEDAIAELTAAVANRLRLVVL